MPRFVLAIHPSYVTEYTVLSIRYRVYGTEYTASYSMINWTSVCCFWSSQSDEN